VSKPIEKTTDIAPRCIKREYQLLAKQSLICIGPYVPAVVPRDNFRRGLPHFKSLPGVPEFFQLYDLKRIAISLMLTGQGVSREAVSHYVDHKGNLETTMIYDLGLVDPLRPVTQSSANWQEPRLIIFLTMRFPHRLGAHQYVSYGKRFAHGTLCKLWC
jgi:hypothetical protein